MPASIVLQTKLHPNCFSEMSNKMVFLLSGILGTTWATHPDFGECGHMFITEDGYLLACEGNLFVGNAEDFDSNIERLLAVAGLTEEEKEEWDVLYSHAVTDHRHVSV